MVGPPRNRHNVKEVKEQQKAKPFKFKAKPVPKGLFSKKPAINQKAVAKTKAAAAAAAAK